MDIEPKEFLARTDAAMKRLLALFVSSGQMRHADIPEPDRPVVGRGRREEDDAQTCMTGRNMDQDSGFAEGQELTQYDLTQFVGGRNAALFGRLFSDMIKMCGGVQEGGRKPKKDPATGLPTDREIDFHVSAANSSRFLRALENKVAILADYQHISNQVFDAANTIEAQIGVGASKDPRNQDVGCKIYFSLVEDHSKEPPIGYKLEIHHNNGSLHRTLQANRRPGIHVGDLPSGSKFNTSAMRYITGGFYAESTTPEDTAELIKIATAVIESQKGPAGSVPPPAP